VGYSGLKDNLEMYESLVDQELSRAVTNPFLINSGRFNDEISDALCGLYRVCRRDCETISSDDRRSSDVKAYDG
jgi:hypothetical protein